MNPTTTNSLKESGGQLMTMLKHFFEKLTDWVANLSWMKFILFVILALIIGGMTQSLIFSSEERVFSRKMHHVSPKDNLSEHGIVVNKSGITIKKNEDDSASPEKQVLVSPTDIKVKDEEGEIHITLPPQVSNSIAEAINNKIASGEETDDLIIRKEKSTWLMSLVTISLFFLFGLKAIMGGKRRAEILAKTAQREAERESLLRQVAEAKVQLMQAQIEPHFLFNTLASVEHLIETDPPRASAMQRSLIQYLRVVIPQMRDKPSGTNLGRETAIVREYLSLLKMRMEERLEYVITISDQLSGAIFPSMMLQILVENAIKHGLEPKTEGGTITIRADVVDNKLQVCVSDNGLGFGAGVGGGTGLGLQNIRDRLSLLYKDNYQFIISPNSPSGVSITIEIPYQNTENP